MKTLYILTITLSLTHASIVARPGTGLQEHSLQRRVWGNIPGDEGYRYRDDPMWSGNRRSGGYSADELERQDMGARRNNRNPPEGMRPRVPSTISRRSTSTDHREIPRTRPRREEQVKRTRSIAYADVKEYENGDFRTYEIGAQFPLPKQGPQAYVKGAGKAGFNRETLAPGGRVSVGTSQTAGVKTGLGPIYIDSSYTTNQDLNPAPRPRPQPVEPVQGVRNTYYMRSSEGRKPVYVDADGHLRSENSGRRIHGDRNVYLNNPTARRSKRSPEISVLGTIETTTNAPSNSSDSLAADWQAYYNIYTALRTNATNLLMPIFNDLVSKSNTSYAYEMAWSIHSQLTGSPNDYEDGPYLNGLASFDDFTDGWLLAQGYWLDNNGTIYMPGNGTISNDTLLLTAQMLSVNDYLQTTYYATWKASVAAVNVTQGGSPHTLLEDLVYYANVVTATNRTDILSENFYAVDLTAAGQEAAWFLDGLNTYW